MIGCSFDTGGGAVTGMLSTLDPEVATGLRGGAGGGSGLILFDDEAASTLEETPRFF